MQMQIEQILQSIKNLPLEDLDELQKVIETERQAKLSDKQIAATNGISVETARQKRRLWISANREKYGGLYVALDGERLLGTGKNYAEAFEAARRAGVENAFVDFIPPIGYVAEIGGWD